MHANLFLIAGSLALLAPLQAQLQTPIVVGDAVRTVSSMSSTRRAVAAMPDGTLWTLVRTEDAVGGGQLYLTRSNDGGRSWTGRVDVPTQADGAGAVCAARDCGRLHLAWHANDTGGYANAYHQDFDTRTGAWIGQPLQLTNATGANDQYYAADVAVTEQGAVLVAITTHRGPPSSTWSSGWSAGIFVRPAGAAGFDPVRQVNTDTFGQRVDMQPVGEIVHMAFRTNTGLYGTRYRAYDVAAAQFTSTADVQVDLGTSNVSQIAADADGGIYVLYTYGDTAPGSGEIRIAYAPPGVPPAFAVQTVAADPDLVRGNVSYDHHSLATTGDGQVWAVYSKRTGEQHRNLYARPYAAGQPLAPEFPIQQGNDPDRFLLVAGVRNPGTSFPPAAVVESRAAVHPGRRLDFVTLAPTARGVRYGVACRGTLARAPLLRTVGWPSTPTALTLELADAPANAAAALLISGACLPVPLDLGAIGLTGCRLELAAPDSAAWGVGSNGTARLVLTTPSPPPFAGVPFQLQALVVAPRASPAGVLLSNAQALVFE
jgi:hypothetical protein